MKSRKPLFPLALILLCALSTVAWRNPRPLTAPARALDQLPPLPTAGPSLDPPRIRLEDRARLAAAKYRNLPESDSRNPVTYNGLTLLHMNVDRARARGEKWIEVSLGDQMLYAWIGDQLANRFLISSGKDGSPTVTGLFRIWARTVSQTMDGGDPDAGTDYSLPNVRWVQYFYHGYAFHGAYWHSNFGSPMSRGCVNLANEDAEWLFNWAFPDWNGSTAWLRSTSNDATLVWVHD